jgi:hypothetical protein
MKAFRLVSIQMIVPTATKRSIVLAMSQRAQGGCLRVCGESGRGSCRCVVMLSSLVSKYIFSRCCDCSMISRIMGYVQKIKLLTTLTIHHLFRITAILYMSIS